MPTMKYIFLLLLLPLPAFAGPIEVAFSPNRGATELIVKTIGQAKHTVRVAAYSFTSSDIAEALLDAHRRGVDVKLVVDRSQVRPDPTDASILAGQGLPVRADYRYAIMHDKFVVVDGETVEEGSFNFTVAAESRNAENVLVIHDADVAAQYGKEWNRLWTESEPIKPNR
jgi:phosphatidylserine/phosphatidylglycerophosphate/cardiolipin synthase-like enzyme